MALIKIFTKSAKKVKLWVPLLSFWSLGLYFNSCFHYNNFVLLMMLTITIFLIELYAFIKFDEITDNIIEDNRTDLNVKFEVKKLKELLKSYRLTYIAATFAFFSNVEFFYLKLLPFNLIGMYIVLWLFLVLFIAAIGYCSYLLFIHMLINITKLKLIEYNYYDPSNTTYIVNIYNLYVAFSLSFLFIGFLFTIIYAIVAPLKSIAFPSGGLSVSHLYEYVFLFSWGVIVFGIIFGYIVLSIYPNILIRKIVNDMKDLSKQMISFYFRKLPSGITNYDRIIVMESYINILEYIDSRKTIINRERTVSLFSFLLMLMSVMVSISSYLEAIMKIQEVFSNINFF